MEGVHILNVIASGSNARSSFTADDEVLNPALRGEICVAFCLIRAKDDIVGYQTFECPDQGRGVAAGQSAEILNVAVGLPKALRAPQRFARFTL